jgi:hypothetical protein
LFDRSQELSNELCRQGALVAGSVVGLVEHLPVTMQLSMLPMDILLVNQFVRTVVIVKTKDTLSAESNVNSASGTKDVTWNSGIRMVDKVVRFAAVHRSAGHISQQLDHSHQECQHQLIAEFFGWKILATKGLLEKLIQILQHIDCL